jgi:hypothetical protein
VLPECSALVETRLCSLVLDMRFVVVFVQSVVVVFGLAGVELCYTYCKQRVSALLYSNLRLL